MREKHKILVSFAMKILSNFSTGGVNRFGMRLARLSNFFEHDGFFNFDFIFNFIDHCFDSGCVLNLPSLFCAFAFALTWFLTGPSSIN